MDYLELIVLHLQGIGRQQHPLSVTVSLQQATREAVHFLLVKTAIFIMCTQHFYYLKMSSAGTELMFALNKKEIRYLTYSLNDKN